MIDCGNYGPVRVLSGAHKGRVGFYDDEDDAGRNAIVYLDEVFEGGYVLIPPEALEPIESAPNLDRFVEAHPEAAAKLNIAARRG